jgi:hypothetical protein
MTAMAPPEQELSQPSIEDIQAHEKRLAGSDDRFALNRDEARGRESFAVSLAGP